MKKLGIFLIVFTFFYSCGTFKEKKSSTNNNINSSSPSQNEILGNQEESQIEIIEQPLYQASPTIYTDLIHTKLEVNFNWENSTMNGIATITASPRFYASDSLFLEAKGMKINSITMDGKDLDYVYNDQHNLRIKLDRFYTKKENYTVVIDYISQPELLEEGGSSAIASDKGLFFINPKGEKKNQMPHIWTQGETESNSTWFPTIDKPNQKTSVELLITVEDKYKTLSNGELLSSTMNGDGTRTDHWLQKLPHAPYLTMLAVGEFTIVKDEYTKADGTTIPVYYYVEPEWEEYAKDIFGETPAMIKFFSELLGVEYPWDKFHQIIVREYVSGAMENTGAVVFGDYAYKTKRELLDSDDQSTIAHELFHHWFGDLVTIESWSNLPLNESFANYSQYLWAEHHKGRDYADYSAIQEANGYYQTAQQMGHHNMVWYDYDHRDEMFDAHSYNKGGRILHMLRCYLGDEAFFSGLKYYLEENAFGTVELANLRMAFEHISGEDLNWFFNQWFLASRHPELEISQEIKEHTIHLKIVQKQDLEKAPLYRLPLKVGVYANNEKKSYDIVVDKNINEYTFTFEGELQNIIVDEDRALLGEVNHTKPREWYVHQYYNAPRYIDREEALNKGMRVNPEQRDQMILDALNDHFSVIRKLAITKIDKLGKANKEGIIEKLKVMATEDPNSRVRAGALDLLGKNYLSSDYSVQAKEILKDAISKDLSYLVISQGLRSLTRGNSEDIQLAMDYAKKLETENSSSIKATIIELYSKYGDESHTEYIVNTLENGEITGYNAIGAITNFVNFYNQLEIKDKAKYFRVFENVATDGGAYIRAILPYSLMNVQASLSGDKERIENDSNNSNQKEELEIIDNLFYRVGQLFK